MKKSSDTDNVQNFATIDDLCEFLVKQGVREQAPTFLSAQLRWELFASAPPSNRIRILPSHPPPVLFRGQTMRHRPCFPAGLRQMAPDSVSSRLPGGETASAILNLMQTEWFNHNLRRTAAMRWMSSKNLDFDETAIAQHYGVPTRYLDLTQSLEIAAFFACCKRTDACDEEWQPIEEGRGVIYALGTRSRKCRPICLQPFPRPSEQWAWVYEVTQGEDFDMLSHVRRFEFTHSLAASQRILEGFDGGAELFPPDPISKLANMIKKSRCMPKSVADSVIGSLGVPDGQRESLLHIVAKEGCVRFSESQSVLVMDSAMEEDLQRVWTERSPNFFKNVGFRLMREKRRAF